MKVADKTADTSKETQQNLGHPRIHQRAFRTGES